MKSKPVFLNLFLIKFPINAIISIIHRVTGIALFFTIPILMYILQLSLESEDKFNEIKYIITNTSFKIIFITITCTGVYHLIAGIRHIMMDHGFFKQQNEVEISSYIFIAIITITFIIIGFYIW